MKLRMLAGLVLSLAPSLYVAATAEPAAACTALVLAGGGSTASCTDACSTYSSYSGTLSEDSANGLDGMGTISGCGSTSDTCDEVTQFFTFGFFGKCGPISGTTTSGSWTCRIDGAIDDRITCSGTGTTTGVPLASTLSVASMSVVMLAGGAFAIVRRRRPLADDRACARRDR